MEIVPREDLGEFAALGELALDGTLTAVAGVLPAAIAAASADLLMAVGKDMKTAPSMS